MRHETISSMSGRGALLLDSSLIDGGVRCAHHHPTRILFPATISMKTTVFLSLSTMLFFASPSIGAQDYSPHELRGTLPSPKLPLRLRGRYTAELARDTASQTFTLEICPTRHAGMSEYVKKRIHRDFLIVAKRVCGENAPVLHGELRMDGYIGHGGAHYKRIQGDFSCAAHESGTSP
ncbi:MAG: hypothetical protein IT473_04520 [Lysobacter sp.]|nr:hypothetical protein [Lysobacter sp.]